MLLFCEYAELINESDVYFSTFFFFFFSGSAFFDVNLKHRNGFLY